MGTQTTAIPHPTLSDASTQCCLPLDIRNTATETEHHQDPTSPPHTPAVPSHSTREQREHENEYEEGLQGWQGSAVTLAETHTHAHTHTQERNTPLQARGGAHTPTPELIRFGPVPAVPPLRTWAQHRPMRQACVNMDHPLTPILGGGPLFQQAKGKNNRWFT